MEEGGAKLNGINALLYGAGGISGVTAFELAQSGVKKLYEIKLALFSALMNKDLDSAIEQTHRIMDVAKNDLGFYGA